MIKMSKKPETSKVDDNLNFNVNKIVNDALRVFYKDAVRIALTNPSQSVFFLRTLRWQNKAAKIRQKLEAEGHPCSADFSYKRNQQMQPALRRLLPPSAKS